MTATVCAIIPTYNRSALLRDCIDSLLAQTRLPDQIIVVNDGSADDTEAVVRSYGDRITLLTKENGGKSTALNFALAQSNADYIWICDDDDLALLDGLEKLLQVFDENPETDFAFGKYRLFWENNGERIYQDPPAKARAAEDNIALKFLEDMFTCQFAMLVRSSLYREVGPFREDLIRSQDHDMSIRLSRIGKGKSTDDVIFLQRQHTGIRGSNRDRFEASNNSEKWLHYGKQIFAQVYSAVALEDFTPSFARGWNLDMATRAALIERACIFIRRGMWDIALNDLEAASTITAEPISQEEITVLEFVTNAEPVWLILLAHRDYTKRLRQIYRKTSQGRAIVLAMSRPLVWYAARQFKIGHILKGLAFMLVMLRVLGVNGTLARLKKSLED